MDTIGLHGHLSAEELAGEVWDDESPAAVARSSPPTVRMVPVGLADGRWRLEHDSLGEIDVPADRYWGAQTQRSLEHLDIGTTPMPFELIHAYAPVKAAAARANTRLGALEEWKEPAILAACEDLAAGRLDAHFPLSVYQTGSGTHTHANVNEVLANRASQLLGSAPGRRWPVDPSDDVNRSQSTNDTFVTAMHVAALESLHGLLLPAVASLGTEIASKAGLWSGEEKTGRTHLMDDTGLTMGQEWSGYAAALDAARRHALLSAHDLLEVALGGTAVGTGMGAPEGFASLATALLAEATGRPFRPAADPFGAQSTLDALVRSHAAIKGLAVTLFKLANDLRWMASGPDHGLRELVVPELEAGSTMMPGKVNPTQAEAMLMVCARVMGNDVVVATAGAEGNFELNAFRPVAMQAYLESARLLADACVSLARFLVHDVQLGPGLTDAGARGGGVTLATALASLIGYDRAARIFRSARRHNRDVAGEAERDGVPAEIVERARVMARRS